MKQALATVSLLVPSYEAGIRFYVDVLGFRLVEGAVWLPRAR